MKMCIFMSLLLLSILIFIFILLFITLSPFDNTFFLFVTHSLLFSSIYLQSYDIMNIYVNVFINLSLLSVILCLSMKDIYIHTN